MISDLKATTKDLLRKLEQILYAIETHNRAGPRIQQQRQEVAGKGSKTRIRIASTLMTPIANPRISQGRSSGRESKQSCTEFGEGTT